MSVDVDVEMVIRAPIDGASVEATLLLLQDLVDQAHPIGEQWLRRAGYHLCQRLDRELRDGHQPITTEQQATAVLKAMGHHLKHAAAALLRAAEHLKAAGKVNAANETHLAYKRILQAAEELLP